MSRGGDWIKTTCITALGSGFAPIASGTWGSAVAVLLFVPVWLVLSAGGAPRWGVEVALILGTFVASWLSVLWGEWAVERFARKDPKQFTLDEVAGQWVAMLVLPVSLGADWTSLAWVIFGQFLLFRIFDIIKPPPARQFERLHAGWGILVDDLFAGAYANIVGQVVWRLTPVAAALNVKIAT